MFPQRPSGTSASQASTPASPPLGLVIDQSAAHDRPIPPFAIVLLLLGSVLITVSGSLRAAEAGDGRCPPQEQAILRLQDRIPSTQIDERLAALQRLGETPAFASTRDQALVTWRQCVLSAHAGNATAPFEERLARLQHDAPAEAAIPVFARFCVLVRDFKRGDSSNAFEGWRETLVATASLGLPLLR